MQWFEPGLRAACMEDARRMVEALLNDRALLPDDAPARPLETRHDNRPHRVQTLFGPVRLRRSYYHHVPSHTGRCPLDEALDLTRGHTPALARLVCRAAAQSGSYDEAAADLGAYAGLQLEARGFGRLVADLAPVLRDALDTLPAADKTAPAVLYVSHDGTGVPMRRGELAGVKGKQQDGSARTREAKLGCVFTQTTTGQDGGPLRDPDSTSYTGTFADSHTAGSLLRREALRRGLGSAKCVVYIGDGAAWVWENALANFPGAVQILDFYHASEHAGTLASALWGSGSDQAKERQSAWCRQMKDSDSSAMIAEARRLLDDPLTAPPDPARREEAQRELNYFDNHRQRTRYGLFRANGWFIGSGVVEAGCKTVVGRRLKQSGMFWSKRGADDLLALRCLILGPHFDAAWSARRSILATQRNKARRWSAPSN